MIDLKVEVLDCKSGVSKKGTAYHIALVRTVSGVGKVFSDVALPRSSKEVVVTVDLSSNTEMFLTPRIKGIKA